MMKFTRVVVLFAVVPSLGASALGQKTREHQRTLAAASVAESGEHDLRKAAKLYREVAEDNQAEQRLRAQAQLSLGNVLSRLGRHAEAREWWTRASQGAGNLADQARAALADTDGDRERKLRERARKALEGNVQIGHLRWIGTAAMPEVAKVLAQQWQKHRSFNTQLGNLVWEVGGAHAKKFLQSVAKHPDEKYRSLVATCCNYKLSEDMVPFAIAWLGDEGLTAASIRVLANAVRNKAPLEKIVALTAAKNPEVRVAGWGCINMMWPNQDWRDERRVRVLLPALEKGLESDIPGVTNAVRMFLQRWGCSTRSLRSLMLRKIPGLPRRESISVGYLSSLPRNSNREEILRVAKELGPYDESDLRKKYLADLIIQLRENWGDESLAAALDLLKLGYMRDGTRWLSNTNGTGSEQSRWFRNHIRSENAELIIEKLAGTEHLPRLCNWISYRDVPEATFGAFLKSRKAIGDRISSRELAAFYGWVGRTGAPEAADYFLQQLRVAKYRLDVALGLVQLSKRKENEQTRRVLREAMLIPTGKAANKKSASMARNAILARLIEIGDVAGAKLWPRVEALGLRQGKFFLEGSFANLDALKVLHWWSSSEKRLVHRFSDQGLREVLTFYLDHSDKTRMGLSGFILSGSAPTNRTDKTAIPLVVEWLTKRLRENRKAIGEGTQSLLHKAMWRQHASLVPDAAFDGLVEAALRHPSGAVRHSVLSAFSDFKKATAVQQDLLLGIMATDSSLALSVARQWRWYDFATEEEVQTLLRTASKDVRANVLGNLGKWRGSSVETAIEYLGKTDHAPTLVSLVQHLSRAADKRAVPGLMKLLTSAHANVRTAAASALRSIRFYHDQKDYWNKALAEQRIDGASAADALLKQADPKRKKATRLLAIRSLGDLGKPEALPFLIQYTEESDTDVATAARSAIDAIHKKQR